MKQEKTKKPRKKEKWNLKPWLLIGAAILLLIGITAIITYCSGKKEVLKFTYENGEYFDEKNGITYVAAPFYYQSQLLTSIDYPYAESNLFTLYRVGYRDDQEKAHLVDAKSWLSTGSNDGAQLYYNPDKVELPEMNEFEGDTIYICEPDGMISTTALEGATAQKLLNDFFSEEGSDYDVLYFGCDLVANLKVSSEKYPWLYLNLWLYSDSDGKYYIGESITRKFHETDASVFEPIFREPTES